MRNHICKLILLIVLLLFCKTASAIGLTEFTKQLVELYVSTYKVPNEDIVVCTNADTLCYRVFIYPIDPNITPLSGPEYMGKVKHNNRYVYLFGQQHDIFHTGEEVEKSELKASEKFDGIDYNFDPIEWDICIDKKNLKLNKQYTTSNILVRLQDGQFTTGMDSAILVQIEKIVSTYCGK